MNLDDMIKLAEEQVQRVLLRAKEELTPMWLTLNGDGRIEVIATPWHGDGEKYAAVEYMRDWMREHQVIAYSLLVEAWFANVPADSKEMAGAEYIGPRPSERADRKESVLATAANHWGQSRHRQWEIVRDKKGRCKELRRLDWPEDKITSAIFDNLLQSRGRAN